MTQRISALHPGLPAPVTSKLLQQDAGELDFRVGHPEALNEQVEIPEWSNSQGQGQQKKGFTVQRSPLHLDQGHVLAEVQQNPHPSMHTAAYGSQGV